MLGPAPWSRVACGHMTQLNENGIGIKCDFNAHVTWVWSNIDNLIIANSDRTHAERPWGLGGIFANKPISRKLFMLTHMSTFSTFYFAGSFLSNRECEHQGTGALRQRSAWVVPAQVAQVSDAEDFLAEFSQAPSQGGFRRRGLVAYAV